MCVFVRKKGVKYYGVFRWCSRLAADCVILHLRDFGAWLWTDNVITQFVQAMNNPMDGIITLHKIFAMPVDSGNGTYTEAVLDSEVRTTIVAHYATHLI